MNFWPSRSVLAPHASEFRNEQVALEQAKRKRLEVRGALGREFKYKNRHLQQLREDAYRLQGLMAALQQARRRFTHRSPRRTSLSLRGQVQWPIQGEFLGSFSSP